MLWSRIGPRTLTSSKQPQTISESATASRRISDLVGGSLRAADAPDFYLAPVEGAQAGQWVKLGEAPVTLGRDRHLDIVLPGTDVSRTREQIMHMQIAGLENGLTKIVLTGRLDTPGVDRIEARY